MINFFKKNNQFHLIFIIFSIFFSIILFLSAPTLFDYKKMHQKIQKEIESEFNININKITKINYGFMPSPHLVVEKAELKIEKDLPKIADLKNVKLFISLFDLYNYKNITIKKIELNKENLYFDNLNFKKLINHFYEKKNKPILLKKSNFFFVDKGGDVVTISPIRKFFYWQNNDTNQKKIKITGNIFDSDYNFNWDKDINKKPQSSNFILKFKNPKLFFENSLVLEDERNVGKLKTKFLNHTIEIKYLNNDEGIFIDSIGNKQDKFAVDGKIELNPFFFDINASIKKQKIGIFIKTILLNYFNYKEDIHENLNGKITLKLNKIDNAYFNSGFFEFDFYNRQIFIENNKVKIRNIGDLSLKNSLFYENNGAIYFAGEIELNINNQDEFYRRFSIPIKKRIDLKKINFVYQTNIDSDSSSISNVIFNKESDFEFNFENVNNSIKNNFDNYQKFRNVVKEEFIRIN